jgi:hypothetical protein
LATRAVYTFTGFPQAPLRHLYLHHDGYPSGAACRFQTALQHCTRPVEFLDRFQRSQPGCIALDGLEQAADAAYRYRLEYGCAPSPDLQVEAWCRSPAGPGWMLRCARMPLVVFIRRFLPGERSV